MKWRIWPCVVISIINNDIMIHMCSWIYYIWWICLGDGSRPSLEIYMLSWSIVNTQFMNMTIVYYKISTPCWYHFSMLSNEINLDGVIYIYMLWFWHVGPIFHFSGNSVRFKFKIFDNLVQFKWFLSVNCLYYDSRCILLVFLVSHACIMIFIFHFKTLCVDLFGLGSD